MLLITLLEIPLIAAVISAAVPRRWRWLDEYVAIGATLLEAILALVIAHRVALGETVSATWMFAPDALGALVLAIAGVVGFAAAIHSVGHLRAEASKGILGFSRIREYFILFHLFFFAMFAAAASTTPLLTWVAIEATTLATAFLITIYNKPSALEAGWKHLIINSVGLLFGLLGTLLFLNAATVAGAEGVRITWSSLTELAAHMNPLLVQIAFVFILVGYGTKTGFVPLHTWKPDAYSKAPAPIAALLSGVLMSVSFAAILHFMGITNSAIAAAFTQKLLIAFGILSVLTASLLMVRTRSYKRLLAYSSIEHGGVMALGFGFGGAGIAAALFHMLYHALAKPLLFFSAGNIFLKYSSTKVHEVRGAYTLLPVSAVVFMTGILAASGMPPFGIFFTKLAILGAGISEHPYIVMFAVIGFAAVFAGLIRTAAHMLFGEPPRALPAGESNSLTLVSLTFIALIFIVLSVWVPSELTTLVTDAAEIVQPAAEEVPLIVPDLDAGETVPLEIAL